MFREVLRKKQALSKEECIKILKEEKRGVLSVLGDDDYPYGMPINHWYNEDNGHIYFHGGKIGHKIDAMKKHDKVSLCVYDEGYMNEGEWFRNINSVIVFGRVKFVEDYDEAMETSKQLSYKFIKDDTYINDEIEKYGPAALVVEIIPEHITGKLVHER